MDQETRISSLEKFLSIKLGYIVPTDNSESSETLPRVEIANLNQIKSAGAYKLTKALYTLSTSFEIPDNVDLDVTGSTFTLNTDWNGIFKIKDRKNINITGGTFNLGKNSSIAIVDGSSTDILFKDQTLSPGSGNGYRIINGDGITLDGLKVTDWYNYCTFIGPDSDFDAKGNLNPLPKNLTIQNWNINGGGTNESCIRAYANGLLIQNNILYVDKPKTKVVAGRLHQGSNYIIRGNKIKGVFGLGPMDGGNGGQDIGTVLWVNKDRMDWTTTDKNQANVVETLRRRQIVLDFRTTNVLFQDNDVEGKIGLNPGLVGAIIDNNRITNNAQPPVDHPTWPAQNECFYNLKNEYPDGTPLYAVKLPGDKTRPAVDVTITNNKLIGKVADMDGIIKIGAGNILNGKSI